MRTGIMAESVWWRAYRMAGAGLLAAGMVVAATAVTGTRGREAREQAQAGDSVLVYLDSVDAVPGSEKHVPLTLFFTGQQEAPISALRATVCVSEQYLRLERAEPGPAGQAAGVKITVKREAKPREDCTPVTLDIAFAKPPQRGAIARVAFLVKKDAPIDQRFNVRTEVVTIAASGQERKLEPSDSEIAIVQEIVVPACFFYMH